MSKRDRDEDETSPKGKLKKAKSPLDKKENQTEGMVESNNQVVSNLATFHISISTNLPPVPPSPPIFSLSASSLAAAEEPSLMEITGSSVASTQTEPSSSDFSLHQQLLPQSSILSFLENLTPPNHNYLYDNDVDKKAESLKKDIGLPLQNTPLKDPILETSKLNHLKVGVPLTFKPETTSHPTLFKKNTSSSRSISNLSAETSHVIRADDEKHYEPAKTNDKQINSRNTEGLGTTKSVLTAIQSENASHYTPVFFPMSAPVAIPRFSSDNVYESLIVATSFFKVPGNDKPENYKSYVDINFPNFTILELNSLSQIIASITINKDPETIRLIGNIKTAIDGKIKDYLDNKMLFVNRNSTSSIF